MRKIIILLVALISFSVLVNAQKENTPKVNVTGRVLLDAGVYSSNKSGFVSGVAIPDARIGVKSSYGRYKAKVDVGFAYGSVSLKDIFIEGKIFPNALLRIGNFGHQFGLQSATTSSMKVTMEEPTCNEAFANPRLIGAMFLYDKEDYFGAISIHAENQALKASANNLGKMGYGVIGRFVYRPLRDPESLMFQIGLSGAYETPTYNSDEKLNHSSFVLGANFPTRVSKVKALNAVVTDAKYLFKFTPELLLAYGRVALESQYYYLQINRKNELKNYNASGAYGILRGLIIGDCYKHLYGDCGLATPEPGSLECAIGYNYTNMSDKDAGIIGGRFSDISLTFNYYINKYMICRLRYSYSQASNRIDIENQNLNTVQTRLQIIF